MPIEDITSKDKYVGKHATMYNKIVATWGYDTLTDMLRVFRATRGSYRGLFFLFSKDLKHVWLIANSDFITTRYDCSYANNEKLLVNLVKENNYNLEKVAKVLGIEPIGVLGAINNPYSLSSVLPMLEFKDMVEERQIK